MDIASSIAGARCAVHPEELAVTTCPRCGSFACDACLTLDGGLCDACAEASASGRYHVVPPMRFAWMSVITLGLYTVYWMYKQWSRIKRLDGSDIWLLPRAIFGPFTHFSLISDVNTRSVFRGLEPVSAVGAVVVIAGRLFKRAPPPFGFIAAFAWLGYLPVVQRIYDLAPPVERTRAEGFHTRHFIASALGALMWCVLIYGAFVPEDPGAY